MLEIKILASGSGGNAYLVDNDRDRLLIEAGIPLEKIQKGLSYELNKVAGCLISHSHL